MIEVNTSGSYYACEEMFPRSRVARGVLPCRVPCTVGTDAS